MHPYDISEMNSMIFCITPIFCNTNGSINIGQRNSIQNLFDVQQYLACGILFFPLLRRELKPDRPLRDEG